MVDCLDILGENDANPKLGSIQLFFKLKCPKLYDCILKSDTIVRVFSLERFFITLHFTKSKKHAS